MASRQSLSPRLTRITLSGEELEGLTIDEPAASLRLLIPSPGDELVIPSWEGNEFLLPDGSRPIIRTLTPRAMEHSDLMVDIVLHDEGAMANWAASVQPGAPAAISGMGRGYTIDPRADGHLLAGDESALPAISQLLEWLPPDKAVVVFIEVGAPHGRVSMPSHPRALVEWVDAPADGAPGDALVGAVEATPIPDGWRVWAAGEAASMFRIRKHLFETLGLDRRHATVRGYWKHGRTGPGS